MGLSVVTGPTEEPISLEEIRAHLRVTSNAEDGLIAGFILAARQFVEDQTRRKLVTQTLDFTVDWDWPLVGCYRRIELPILPVTSVASVKYIDSNGSEQTLDSGAYVVRTNGAVAFIDPAYNATWPAVRRQSSAITVRFVAGSGLSDIPNPLMQVLRMLVGHMYANREAVGATKLSEIPLGVEALLSGYRLARLA